MELLINDKILIADLQKKFNAEFPYLKIEFFDHPRIDHHGLPKSQMYGPNVSLRSCRKLRNEGSILVAPTDLVESVERQFWEKFGLTAEIFRKSGKLWIETTLSDSWTLQQQNDEGKAFSTTQHKAKQDDEDITDRDIWE